MNNTTKKLSNHSSWVFDNEKLIEKLESAYQKLPDENNSNGVMRTYGFKVGDMNLIIDEATTCEILEVSNIHYVPLSAKWLIGVSNIRGDVIPVIDLEELVTGNSKEAAFNNGTLAVLGEGENSIGIELDELPVLLEFTKTERLIDYSGLTERIQPFIQYAYKKDADIWLCINFESFIQTIAMETN
ncbi:MAG: chemotaxis protein CheW [Gammaproteobacteria bacterium]